MKSDVMENKIILIVLAVFCISILLAQNNLEKIYAVTIETATFGAVAGSSGSTWNNCAYVSTTEVWCPTSTGLKIWNPTTRVVSSTLKPTGVFTDVKCSSSVCYAWESAAGTTGNLTRWLISGHTLDDFQPFIGNAGFVTGHGIGLVTGGDNTVLLPIEGQTCTDGVIPLGSNDDKGFCFWGGGSGASFDGERWISAQTTNDLARIHDIEWNGQSASIGSPTANRAVVEYNDLGGTNTFQLINLADSDTTFITTRICETASLPSQTNQAKITIINGILFDTYSTSDMVVMDTTLNTCTVGIKTNLVDEGTIRTTTYDSTNDIYIVSATDTNGGNEASAIYTFNGTTFDGINTVWDKILKVNTTDTTNRVWTHFNHNSEGEIQVWRGTQMVIISDLITESEPNPNTEFCSLPENFNLLRCVLERGDTTPLIGASQLLNESSTTLVCQIGLISCTDFVPDNPDIKTNGVGYILLFVALGIMIGIFWVASRGDLGSIPTFLWFIATISIVGLVTALNWIDPTFIIVAIIAVIALATAKAKGVFGSSGLFAGET